MRRAFSLAIAAAALTAVMVFGCDAAERSSVGAFMPNRSNSVQSLVQQLSGNQTALARYSRHYGMSPEAVLKYFKENLVLTTLKQPIRAQVFYLTPSGRVLSKQKNLPTGTRVFATLEGLPILEWRCSNPIGRSLPVRQVVKPKPKPQPVVQVKPNPPIEIIQPQLTTLVTTVEPIETPMVAAIVPNISASPSISLPHVLVGAVVPALVGAFRVHESAPSAVPEPGSFAALGMGICGILVGCRRKLKA